LTTSSPASRNESPRGSRASGVWLLPPPRLRAESGVREQSYALDGDLDFLDLQAKREDPLWPFDFMLQITFDSPAYFADADSGSDFDAKPFEFPVIKDEIHAAVAEAVTSGSFNVADAERALADLREFDVLQRFFRLAFEGRLGDSFPIEKLVELGRIPSIAAQPEVRTPNWNIFDAKQRQTLLDDGVAAEQLAALGYERDYEDFLLHGNGECPAIPP
jgi:hypothetical protein